MSVTPGKLTYAKLILAQLTSVTWYQTCLPVIIGGNSQSSYTGCHQKASKISVSAYTVSHKLNITRMMVLNVNGLQALNHLH